MNKAVKAKHQAVFSRDDLLQLTSDQLVMQVLDNCLKLRKTRRFHSLVLSQDSEKIYMKLMIQQIIEEEIKSTHNLSETADQFIERVTQLFVDEFHHLKKYAPLGLYADVIEEVQQEVLNLYRIKTYGHYSLQSYRLSLLQNPEPTALD